MIYGICLIITILVFIYMAQKNYDNIDIYQWTIVILIPVVIMAYWLKTRINTPESAEILFCFIYLDSTIMLAVILFSLMRTLDIKIRPWMKILAYGLAAMHVAVVALCLNTDLYYKTVIISHTSLGSKTILTAGPLRIGHYIYLALMVLWLVAILVISFKKKGAFAKGNLFIYMIIMSCGVIIYFIEGVCGADFSLLPILYTVADLTIAARYDYAHKHDISLVITDHRKQDNTKGLVALGLDGLFLSCNEKSHDFLPFLKNQTVNEAIPQNDPQAKAIYDLIRAFERDGTSSTKYQVGDMTCVCEISYFSISHNGKGQGYFLEIRDATEEQRAYDIMANYNETLNEEVKNKTDNIKEIQRKIVLSMADMIENRDNNTGGHVKRTSDVIHILLDEIVRQGKMPITDQMKQDIIRAAPTHDLGKLTIDSSILNKPGRFNDEEYAIMKTHSTKSGEMVRILLEGVEEERFVDVAYNVARYHHERWDGRGYPEGLVGTMIPLEARIMAIADVYDALVSKRVYKDAMSFEKSASIMCEGMGTQFDPNMKEVFLGCREKMEEYYVKYDA